MNRIARAEDFRSTVRRGRRAGLEHAVVYVAERGDSSPTRFGFIVSKAVGNSVVRHRMARRLRAVGHELLPSYPTGRDVIVRALPGSPEVSWSILHGEISDGLERSTGKR
ncbi:ribonuclease P protein component [Galbitalea soli]|uniref:ribonuclease P protein component n=1 Tax=Galbitalea soli TaxID=1268042 RepID=UPI003BAB9FF9